VENEILEKNYIFGQKLFFGPKRNVGQKWNYGQKWKLGWKLISDENEGTLKGFLRALGFEGAPTGVHKPCFFIIFIKTPLRAALGCFMDCP
jgi:hypothetical protein